MQLVSQAEFEKTFAPTGADIIREALERLKKNPGVPAAKLIGLPGGSVTQLAGAEGFVIRKRGGATYLVREEYAKSTNGAKRRKPSAR